jgi:hypothetical protein
MNFIKERMVSGFDNLLTRLLVKRFGLLDSNDSQKSACPELEMLTVYLEHNLTENQTRKIEGHLVECRLCRKTVINTFRSQKFVSDSALNEVKKL